MADWSAIYVGRGTTALSPADKSLYQNERYFDPWWACVDKENGPNESTNSLAYLRATPANGTARVAAMRARMDALGHLEVGRTLRELQRSSANTFMDVASDIERSVGTAAGRKDLAERLGVPVSTIESKRDQLLGAFGGRPEVKVLFDRLGALIGPPILTGIREAVSSIAGASSTLKGFSSAMAAVPFIGQMVTFVVDMVAKANEDKKAAERAACADSAQKLEQAVKALAAARWPFQWHWEPFGPIGCTVDAEAYANAEHQSALHARLMEWLTEFDAIGKDLAYRSKVKEWWSLAMTYASDPDVARVFNSFGRDYWGGRLASDEQVMLVAIPVAVANGWTGAEADKFAAALWNRSHGWSSANAGLLRKDDLRRERLKCPGTLAAGSCVGTGEYETRCKQTVRNALFVQYAVLAKDALDLAAEWRAGMKSGAMAPIASRMPSIGETLFSTGSAGWLGPILGTLGALGSGAAWWFKLPLVWVATPAIVGLGAWYAASRPKSAVAIGAALPVKITTPLGSKLGVSGFDRAPPAWRMAR